MARTSLNGVSAPTLTSTVSTGTAPLAVTSTTKVANLNADQVDGLSLWTGTQAAYTALGTYDSATLYVITP